MKFHAKRPFVSLLCLHIAACLLLSATSLASCSPSPQPEDTTPPVLNQIPEETTTPPSVNNQVNEPEQPSDPNGSAGNTNVGNSSTDSNESKGLTFLSNGGGTCTLTGLGTCSDVCLVIPSQSPSGERVTAIASKAFYGNTTVTAIFLPSSVTSIGSMAFSAMPALAYLSVDPQNPSFRADGGVLYSKDGSNLIVYPAAKSAAVLQLPASVRTISEMAFYGCSNLKSIAYEGTQSSWQQITVATGNNSLFGLQIQYNAGAGK